MIRETRKKLDVTQKALALTSGTGLRFIIELKKGKETCEIGKALTVLNTLGITAGGGPDRAMSLAQLNRWCDTRFGAHLPESDATERPYDIQWMIMDNSQARRLGAGPLAPSSPRGHCHARRKTTRLAGKERVVRPSATPVVTEPLRLLRKPAPPNNFPSQADLLRSGEMVQRIAIAASFSCG
jgi:hypothetical protein